MREKACSKGQVPVASWFPEGQNSVEFYLSVYTGKTKSYCRLERVIILVNSKKDRMTCGCQWHQLRKGCVHKNLAKWYLNQYHSSRITTKVESEKIDLMSDVHDFAKLLETNNLSIDVDVESVKCMVNYIFMRRKVPVHIDDYILNIDNSETKEITPTEVECPECSGDLQTCKVELVTSNGIIVSHKYVIKYIKVYRMQCKCGLIIRHQDYTSNLWNFNDFLFLTVDFCIWLRNNLQCWHNNSSFNGYSSSKLTHTWCKVWVCFVWMSHWLQQYNSIEHMCWVFILPYYSCMGYQSKGLFYNKWGWTKRIWW